jgi:hypothetical protein
LVVWVGAGEAGRVSPVMVEKNLMSWASDLGRMMPRSSSGYRPASGRATSTRTRQVRG